jgi:hypothetical protein
MFTVASTHRTHAHAKSALDINYHEAPKFNRIPTARSFTVPITRRLAVTQHVQRRGTRIMRTSDVRGERAGWLHAAAAAARFN